MKTVTVDFVAAAYCWPISGQLCFPPTSAGISSFFQHLEYVIDFLYTRVNLVIW